MLKKISNGCVHIVQRYLPDPFIFCILLTIVVFIAAIPAAGATPLQVVGFWGTSIWSLLAFSMQMALVLVLGTAMATAPPVKRLLDKIAGVAKTPFSAIVLVNCSWYCCIMVKLGLRSGCWCSSCKIYCQEG